MIYRTCHVNKKQTCSYNPTFWCTWFNTTFTYKIKNKIYMEDPYNHHLIIMADFLMPETIIVTILSSYFFYISPRIIFQLLHKLQAASFMLVCTAWHMFNLYYSFVDWAPRIIQLFWPWTEYNVYAIVTKEQIQPHNKQSEEWPYKQLRFIFFIEHSYLWYWYRTLDWKQYWIYINADLYDKPYNINSWFQWLTFHLGWMKKTILVSL